MGIRGIDIASLAQVEGYVTTPVRAPCPSGKHESP
jgi:hypothetical protein